MTGAAPHPAHVLRPGERIVAGRPHVFDLGALGDWLASQAALEAPDSLSGLSDDALAGLYYRGLRLAAASGHRDLTLALEVTAERRRRALLTASA